MIFSKKQIRTAIRQFLLSRNWGEKYNRPKFVKILDIRFSEKLQVLEVRFTTGKDIEYHEVRFFDSRNLLTKSAFPLEPPLTEYETKLLC